MVEVRWLEGNLEAGLDNLPAAAVAVVVAVPRSRHLKVDAVVVVRGIFAGDG